MQAITTESLAAMLALIGVVIVVSALLSGFVERSNFPQVAVFLILGAVLGPSGVNVLHVGLDSPVLRVVATLSLALVLFVDALNLNLAEVRKKAVLTSAILGPGTLAATLLMGLAGHYLLGLDGPQAAILAAALASTDPVILRGLLRRPDLPGPVRLSLKLESGLNDVVLLPIVLVAMALAGTAGSHGVDAPRMLLQMLVLGPGAGAVVALIAIATLEVVRKKIGVRRDYESIYSLGICLAAFAAAESLHGSGFLAAFAAGLTIAALDVELCDCFQEYGETTAEMLLMFTFVLLGASLIWSGLGLITGAFLLFALVALLSRTVSLWVTLIPLKVEKRSRAIIAWFGPRGLSTLLLVLVPAFAGTPGSERLFQYASVVVLFSVVLHGGSIMFFGKGAFRKHEEHELPVIQPTNPAHTHVIVEPANADVLTPEEVLALIAKGDDVRLGDVRSEKSFLNASDDLQGAVRLQPDRARAEVERLGLPKTAWIALFCTCPAEETSLRVMEDLRKAGYARAVAVKGGYESMQEAGFRTVERP
jgi:NhaP-type Na+/H+ or K+/H+ antiporter/rhodanese-related sulfurtransferase